MLSFKKDPPTLLMGTDFHRFGVIFYNFFIFIKIAQKKKAQIS